VAVALLIAAGALLGSATVVLFVLPRHRGLLVACMLVSASALLLVTGWLLTDPATSKGDALKDGGLAGAAILALYALWINDRRRRTEEARHEVERGRAQQDRDRVDDERFAKAVELLGHEADQVRVGALHALAGLARNRPRYTQTVLDVLCSYLRRPFNHPSYELRPGNPHQVEVKPTDKLTAEQIAAADHEQQVRGTAQRLIIALLPDSSVAAPALYDLDFTAANLEYLDLTKRQIGTLVARRTRFHGDLRLGSIRVHGKALFSDAVFHGRTDLHQARFDGGLALLNARMNGSWRVPEATVRSFLDLRTDAPEEQIGALTVIGDTEIKLDEDKSWKVTSVPDA
jgi:hypothetical protein